MNGVATPPSAKKNRPASTPPKIDRIVVDPSGRITLNEQAIELPALRTTLFALKADDPDASVVVKGAGDVDYQKVVSVLDLIQQADITKVGLATEVAP